MRKSTLLFGVRKARWKQIGLATRNLPLTVLCLAIALSVEAFACLGILQQNTESVGVLGVAILLAPFEAAISVSCSIAAILGSQAAADLRMDPRPSQKRRAFGAQALAVALLIPPVYYAGNSIAYQAQLSSWRQYHGSAQEAADIRQSQDRSLDSISQRQAAENLKRSARPERAEFDVASTAWAALILGLNMLAAGAFRLPRPETEREAERRFKMAVIAKARETREANKRAAEKAASKLRSAPVPNVVQMLRSGKA